MYTCCWCQVEPQLMIHASCNCLPFSLIVVPPVGTGPLFHPWLHLANSLQGWTWQEWQFGPLLFWSSCFLLVPAHFNQTFVHRYIRIKKTLDDYEPGRCNDLGQSRGRNQTQVDSVDVCASRSFGAIRVATWLSPFQRLRMSCITDRLATLFQFRSMRFGNKRKTCSRKRHGLFFITWLGKADKGQGWQLLSLTWAIKKNNNREQNR